MNERAATRQPVRKPGAEGQYHRQPPPGTNVKVYVVYQRMHRTASSMHKPNLRVLAVKLNRASAQRIVDKIPGTWIEKFYADKE